MNTMAESRGHRSRFPAPAAALGTEFGVIGALSGAFLGAMAGPPGALTGAIIGAAIGALSSLAYEAQMARRDARGGRLDSDLGISEGEIGAPNVAHPPVRIGAFSVAASGASSSLGQTPAAGPFTQPE
jgi:hypothetical protein